MPHDTAQIWSGDGVVLSFTTPSNKQQRLLQKFSATSQQLTLHHSQLAALDAYDAKLLGLPPLLEATLIVAISGRIDHPDFHVIYRLEPFDQSHAWASYSRNGALIEVGARRFLLNAEQYAAFEAIAAMQHAGANVAARLAVWENLATALTVPHRAHILLEGELPRIHLQRTTQLPPSAMVRVGSKLAAPAADERWGMLPHRRYFLRAN